ncbi:MAG: gamma-glutamyl-gamma-aminobutyrate hydrolase family protein [Thermodesulfobacteriota bacterium]
MFGIMKVHVLQHVSFEGLGSMAPVLEARGARVSYTRFFQDDPLPQPQGIDLVIAMGGPMSVNDEGTLSWLKREKEFIRSAVLRGMPVLGVCLGAQLIASAMGSRVYPNSVKEIGWFPVQAVPTPDGVFRFPPSCVAFHWHGETFDLPEAAVRLASSAGCRNQAFQIGAHVMGLQFHLETTPESALALVENCREELVPGPYVQAEAELRAVPTSSYQAINALMNEVLTYLIG